MLEDISHCPQIERCSSEIRIILNCQENECHIGEARLESFGSVQSDPYRWGHATLAGYTPPAGRSTTTATPNVSHPNLDGVLSPQTIYQSATDGVPP